MEPALRLCAGHDSPGDEFDLTGLERGFAAGGHVFLVFGRPREAAVEVGGSQPLGGRSPAGAKKRPHAGRRAAGAKDGDGRKLGMGAG